MNIRAAVFVANLRGLTPSEKAVAFAIARHANVKECEANMSMTTVAEESGLKNRETASRIATRLESYGIIRAVGPRSGGRTPTTYTFTFAVNSDSGITVKDSTTVTGEVANRDSDLPSTVTETGTTVTQNASTVTGESHEGFKVLEGKSKESEGTAKNSSLALFTSKASGKDVDELIAVALDEDPGAQFSRKDKAELLQLLDEVHPDRDWLLAWVRRQVQGYDEFELKTAGGRLTATMIGAARAQDIEAARQVERKLVEDRINAEAAVHRQQIEQECLERKREEAEYRARVGPNGLFG